MAVKKTNDAELVVIDLTQGEAHFAVLGTSPLIFNSMSFKSQQALLGPEATSRKSKADRALAFKHNPIEEYRASVYRTSEPNAETRLCLPAPAFKGAIMTAALDMAGVAKTEIGRLTWVVGHSLPVWGIPELFMSTVRSADMARTPDLRTRAVIRQWCCFPTIAFVQPKLSHRTVSQLLAASGLTVGVGDFRQEKGKGNHGQFQLVEADHPAIKRLQKTAGLKAQDDALETPAFYDAETERLFTWHREFVIKKAAKPTGRRAESPQVE